MADRWEENALLASVLKNIGNKKSALYELQGFNHGTVLEPACFLIINYIRDYCRTWRTRNKQDNTSKHIL